MLGVDGPLDDSLLSSRLGLTASGVLLVGKSGTRGGTVRIRDRVRPRGRPRRFGTAPRRTDRGREDIVPPRLNAHSGLFSCSSLSTRVFFIVATGVLTNPEVISEG